uniref:MARVEL domain-containing protein n=1 Tax=Melopsittacus undulatus TaxID=13146 RepID=A0A8C6NGC0_MELUD
PLLCSRETSLANFSSSAQFFIALAVLVFLYCIAALVVYIRYKHVYDQNRRFPLTVSTFLWLVSTFTWAKVLADIKMYTGASIILGIESCKTLGTTCHFAAVTTMGAPNMSVVHMPSATRPNRISQSPAIHHIQRSIKTR